LADITGRSDTDGAANVGEVPASVLRRPLTLMRAPDLVGASSSVELLLFLERFRHPDYTDVDAVTLLPLIGEVE
jgi:hypothetical protein